jgi:hypothetical protein
MQTTIESAHTGWDTVTDVDCPFCRVGILRWAGYPEARNSDELVARAEAN